MTKQRITIKLLHGWIQEIRAWGDAYGVRLQRLERAEFIRTPDKVRDDIAAVGASLGTVFARLKAIEDDGFLQEVRQRVQRLEATARENKFANVVGAPDEANAGRREAPPLRAATDTATATGAEGAPIDMLLWCPGCGERHVDEGAFVDKAHHTHACQTCGMCWRPAVVATRGVLILPGFKS